MYYILRLKWDDTYDAPITCLTRESAIREADHFDKYRHAGPNREGRYLAPTGINDERLVDLYSVYRKVSVHAVKDSPEEASNDSPRSQITNPHTLL